MPRSMPPLAASFQARVRDAIELAEAGEIARYESAPQSLTRRHLHAGRLEALYEMAYLRVFVSWEAFVEQAFLRYLCGYASSSGTATLVPGGSFERTLSSAEAALLGTRQYVLWHKPSTVISRCRRFFATSAIDVVVSSHTSRLENLASVRHRIAHAQADARSNFDSATMALVGRRYRGSRPGAFLRDWDLGASPPVRWLETLSLELAGLAAQIA